MEVSESVSAKIAEYLLQIHAIKLQPDNPFIWASGWKSPIYSDNRLSLSHPEVRNFVKKELANLVNQKFANAEAIVGVATAGIAPGVLVADELALPFGYVRSEAKKHGMAKQVEGDIKPNQKIVVVEDLVSTGKSSLQAVQSLRDFGADVIGMVSIFTYGFDEALQAFNQADCPYFSLCDYNALIKIAIKNKTVKEEQLELLAQWRNNPSQWGQ